MIKNKKIIMIMIFFLISIYILIFVLMNIPTGEKFKKTVFIGSITKVQIEDNNIKVYNKDIKIQRQKVKVYFDNKFIDAYISVDKELPSGLENAYIITNENGELLLPDNLIAHTNDMSIKIKEKSISQSQNLDKIYAFANNNNIILSKDILLDYMEINILDIDDDGDEEYIYSAGLIEDAEKYMSLVFVQNDNKYTLIKREDSIYDEVSNTRLFFLNLIDFNNDNNYEFVVGKMDGEYGVDQYELYNFNGNSFTKIE